MKSRVFALVGILVLGLSFGGQPARGASAPATTATWTITDLGTLGGPESIAYGVNDAGVIVGQAQIPGRTGAEYFKAFLYRDGQLQDLGTLGATASNHYTVLSEARGINAVGQVAGMSQLEQPVGGGNNPRHAFLWEGGTMRDISGGTSESFAQAINNAGTVVGVASGGPQYPFIVTAAGGLQNLYGLGCTFRSDHQRDGAAFGVNDAGQIVGSAPLEGTLPDVLRHAFRCTPTAPATGTYVIQDLAPLGTQNSIAYAINQKGQSVGWARGAFDGVTEAILWDSAGSAQRLGVVPAGKVMPIDGAESIAYGINDIGWAVGTYHVNGAIWQAFLWRNGVMEDLNDQLPSGSGWALTEARAVNNSGSIVGQGTINGAKHAFLLAAPATVDMTVTAIEVTQAIQDLQNSVTLVANKRTFVRVHVKSDTKDVPGVTARLYGFRNGASLGDPLRPLNNFYETITVRTSPLRGAINDSFYFELPPDWRVPGRLELRAEVNPEHRVAETNYQNNARTQAVEFKPAALLRLQIVDVEYPSGGHFVHASPDDVVYLESQLRRMYPSVLEAAPLLMWRLSISPPALDQPPSLVSHGCESVNAALARLRDVHVGLQADVWYGIVTDRGGFMRGCSPIGGTIASGPAGDPQNRKYLWDTDSTYGDWYGAHEIGHALGREHAPFCKAERADTNPPGSTETGRFPYASPKIGEPDQLKFFGFDMGEARLNLDPSPIYPWATDIMSYCDDEWISQYTYEGLYASLRGVSSPPPAPSLASAATGQAGDFLAVYGSIDLPSQVASLSALSRQPHVASIPPLVPGPYHIRLLDAANGILADYPFTPGDTVQNSEDETHVAVAQIVSFVPGTRRIAIYSDLAQRELGAAPVSANAPTVTITARSGGPALPASGPVTLTWNGADADSDTLGYTVLYSNDDRATWRVLAAALPDTTFTVDASELPGTHDTAGGFFRIVVNDGVLTGSADSPPFSVAGKAPDAEVINPATGAIYQPGQTIVFEGLGRDLEDGVLPGTQLAWSSDHDGALGSGAEIASSTLSVGHHTITLAAMDSTGQTTIASIGVTIATSIAQPSPTLRAAPDMLLFTYTTGGPVPEPQELSIRNPSAGSLPWTASTDASWVTLSALSGTTPADINVTADTRGFAAGETRTAHITIVADGAADSPHTITVEAQSTSPAVVIHPTNLAFVTQAVGTQSSAEVFTLRNDGAQAHSVAAVEFTGPNPNDYIKTADSCSGATIPRGSSCTVGVSFRPTKDGTRSAYLTFSPGASGEPMHVALTGEGLSVATNGILAWGRNNFGQLGSTVSTTCNGVPCASTPIDVLGLSDVTAVAVGLSHSLAVNKDGTVWTWGSNAYGQLGDGTTSDHTTPKQVEGLSDVIAVAASDRHSLALRKDGTVWAWGLGTRGQIGDGLYQLPNGSNLRTRPVQVKGPGGVGYLDQVVAIAAGGFGEENTSMALRSDGTVWTWGNNGSGELGFGSLPYPGHSATPVQVKGPGGQGILSNVIAIAHCMALKSDGTVWTWGPNQALQLGTYRSGTTQPRSSLFPVQVLAFENPGVLTGITAIASYQFQRTALKNDGTVWEWGTIGFSPNNYPMALPEQVFAPFTGDYAHLYDPLTDVVAIQPGLALKRDGTVWTWGRTIYGLLGDGTTSDNYPSIRAVQVKDVGGTGYLGGVTAIASGEHRLVVKGSSGSKPPDRVAPITTATVMPETNPAGWNKTDVTVGLSATDPDGGSGVKEVVYSANGAQTIAATSVPGAAASISITAEGETTITYAAKDNAGNVETGKTLTIKLDKSAPEIDCGTLPTGWQANNITLNCSASDATSGLANSSDTSFQLQTNLASGSETNNAQTNAKTVADIAGNETVGGPFTFMVDRKAPSVQLTCPSSPVRKGSAASASWSASDGGSGVAGEASGSIALETSFVGANRTASLAAGSVLDNMGNGNSTTSCSYGVVYNWIGFFQPIDNQDASGRYIFNQAKAGSTIPVKFSLDGDQGLNIFSRNTDGTYGPTSGAITCDASTAADPVEEYSTATVSGLKYDATANQYIYNWKTASTWAGTCRQLVVTLVDGTVHRANFTFTK
jgi:probable HAF family extracellular repeat protein